MVWITTAANLASGLPGRAMGSSQVIPGGSAHRRNYSFVGLCSIALLVVCLLDEYVVALRLRGCALMLARFEGGCPGAL